VSLFWLVRLFSFRSFVRVLVCLVGWSAVSSFMCLVWFELGCFGSVRFVWFISSFMCLFFVIYLFDSLFMFCSFDS